MGYTRNSIRTDLQGLGVEPGDTLFIHSSFKSLGPVDGGAGTVVAALEDSVGPGGLLLMPSFNLIERHLRPDVWDVSTTPSTVGWLTEYFRRMPGTSRSDHYSHSVSARGRKAEAFVGDHLSREGRRSPWDLEPWGHTYGTHSPMQRAYDVDGKLLMLGTDYETLTYVHLVEAILWQRRLEADADAEYGVIDRQVAGRFWDSTGKVSHGKVGDAECRLFRIRECVDALLTETVRNPEPYWR